MTERFKLVTETAQKCLPSWSNKDKVRFHLWNPNGIMAERLESDERIRAVVDSGLAKSGALLAYGSLCNYHTSKLLDLALKGRVSHHEAHYYVKQIEREIASADAFIASLTVGA